MMMGETTLDEELGNTKLKLHEGEDFISALPDSIIHHILSFLDSTKEAIQTCVLSKRFKSQWTCVPVLIFDLYNKSYEHSSKFIDNTLDHYACSKIQKFCILTNGYKDDQYPYFIEKFSFASRKHVAELILEFVSCEHEFKLAESIFNQSSLVRLQTHFCSFEPNEKVNWEHVKELDLRRCRLSNHAVDSILCGSRRLESLVLGECVGFDQLVIVSKYLKKLEIRDNDIYVLEISCPNLEELYLFGILGPRPIGLMNLSSLKRATLDIEYVDAEGFDESLPRKILQQLQHVKELIFGAALLMILSNLAVRASLSPPLLNNKCLTLDSPEVDESPAGIAYVLRCSHMLEKLVINKEYFLIADGLDSENFEENYWSSNKTVFNCSVSHLKYVNINNLSKTDADYKHVLNFIEFILKNAEVLEKLVVVFEKCEMDFMFEVSLRLLSFPRCSKHAIVEFQYMENRI